MIKFYVFLVVLCAIANLISTQIHGPPIYTENFCKGNTDIESSFVPSLMDGYIVKIKKFLPAATVITVKLDSEGSISFGSNNQLHPYNAGFTSQDDRINNVISFVLLEDYDDFIFTVKDNPRPFQPPYITSLQINEEEECLDPDREYFNNYPLSVSKLWSPGKNKLCGRRKLKQQFNSQKIGSRAGDWPWSVVIVSQSNHTSPKYICGGTLISRSSVLTAAHCVAKEGFLNDPENLNIIVGTNTLEQKQTSQRIEVNRIEIFNGFDPKTMENDIALLTLSEKVVFNNFVQPACLWTDEIYEHLQKFKNSGTIAGWGIGPSGKLYDELQEATVTMVSDRACLDHDPTLYNKIHDGKTFCMKHSSGTSCNADDGGGWVVFVEDSIADNEHASVVPGAWYLKGVVSTVLQDHNACDPYAYKVFTDVVKYRDWILANTK